MGENFCLKWNDYDRNLSSTFCEIRDDNELLDITLACEDEKQLRAHKVILSACSPFFRSILRRNPHDHPLLYLRGVRYKELEAILHFIYNGEVNVSQDELNEFLLVAEDLRIKGLTQSNTSSESKSSSSPPQSSHGGSPAVAANLPNLNRRRRPSNDNTVIVPGVKRAKLSVVEQQQQPQIDRVKSYAAEEAAADPDIIVPNASNLLADDHVSAVAADWSGDPVVAAADTFDESSIIEENYDGEDGEVVGDGDGYVRIGVGGTVGGEDDTSFTSTGTENNTGNLRGYVQCPVCAKLMYRKNLSRHIAVKHSNVKPVQCSLCERTMKNGWSLKEHERKYHGVIKSDRVNIMENCS